MYKLGALDAGFLYNETERSPQHIASVQVLELPKGVAVEDFVADLKKLLMTRLHLVPYFANKLQFVPFNLDHPVWVRDLNFNIDNHVKVTAVAAPGGRAEMDAKIAELHQERLDRSRPLWDLWVLTGLEGGRIAYYNRAHHACLDGVSGQAMIESIMDVTPVPREVEPAPKGFLTKRDHQTPVMLMAGAVENFIKFQSKQPAAWMSHVETAGRLWQRTMDPTKGLGAVAERAPATRFNQGIEKGRTYATGELPLTQIKAICKATDTKINDVFLAACSGGLRRYLEERNELPRESLIAGCPVSMRRPGDTSTNNQVSMMLVSFATNEADPVRRLLSIARSAAAAKGFTADVANSYDADVALPGLPGVMSSTVRLAEALGVANLPGLRPPFNVVVSNVPGPQVQLYSNGVPMVTHYPVSIAAHTQGVNITVQSYNGQLFYAVTACAKALPDAARMTECMNAAFDELCVAVLGKAVLKLSAPPAAQLDGAASAAPVASVTAQGSDAARVDQPRAA